MLRTHGAFFFLLKNFLDIFILENLILFLNQKYSHIDNGVQEGLSLSSQWYMTQEPSFKNEK
jgi:hypothetical protein